MKKYLVFLFLFACNVPDGNIRGRDFWVKDSCIKSHKEKEIGYHWGYTFTKGFGFHWPWQCALNPCMKLVCDENRLDTIWEKHEN